MKAKDQTEFVDEVINCSFTAGDKKGFERHKYGSTKYCAQYCKCFSAFELSCLSYVIPRTIGSESWVTVSIWRVLPWD